MSQPEMMLPDLPPRRPLPPDVRKRLRRRVLGRRLPAGRVLGGGVPSGGVLSGEVPGGGVQGSGGLSGGAARAPLAAAAAVVVLAAGGAIVAQSTQGDPNAVTPPSTTQSTAQSTAVSSAPGDSPVTSLTPGATGGEAARCGFGDGDVRFTLGLAGRRILVTRNGRFCELTHTTVAHDKPEVGAFPFADGAAAVLWRSGSAVLIGRVPIGTSRVRLTSGERSGREPMPVALVDDLFVTPYTDVGMSVEFTTPSGPVSAVIDVEALPGVDAWTVSREELPPGDPEVARCLDRALRQGATWVGDPPAWRPGAFSGPGVDALLAIHDQAGRTAYCDYRDGRPFLAHEEDSSPQRGTSFEVHYVTGRNAGPRLDAAHVVLAGTVDAARVGGVEITDRQGRTVSAVLRDGTFAARLPDQPPLTSNTVAEGFRVRVLDHDNQPIETVTLD